MKLSLVRATSAALFLFTLSTLAACTSEAVIVPSAPPRAGLSPDCPVSVLPTAPPPGVAVLGTVRCAQRADDCTPLVKQRVCAVGGNVVYEWHREKGRRADDADDMVGIVAAR
jgi:hypothetical protein